MGICNLCTLSSVQLTMAPFPEVLSKPTVSLCDVLISKTANFIKCEGLHINGWKLWILDV